VSKVKYSKNTVLSGRKKSKVREPVYGGKLKGRKGSATRRDRGWGAGVSVERGTKQRGGDINLVVTWGLRGGFD